MSVIILQRQLLLQSYFHIGLNKLTRQHDIALNKLLCEPQNVSLRTNSRAADNIRLKEILGHSSSKTTEIYTHVSTKSLQKIISPFDTL